MQPILESIIKCPNCSHEQQEVMPTDACIFFYQCTNCQVLLKPNKGDCCVFVLMELFPAHLYKLDNLVALANHKK